MDYKTCDIKINKLAFTFKVEANTIEEIQIRQKSAEIAGGTEQLISLETTVTKYRDQMLSHNKQKFGENYDNVRNLILGETRDFTEEEKEQQAEFLNNPYSEKYLIAQKEVGFIKDLATLIVLCTKKPKDFDFLESKSSIIEQLMAEYREQIVFFRRAEEETNKTD